MTVPPPIIDHRTYEELVEQTVRLVEQSGLGWVSPQGPQADAGLAMIRLFSHLAKRVGDRLNQVPDKNLLAFLELIGTQLQPPQPARVPLTFALATGTPSDAFVPARTQVAAPPQEGETAEVIFETEQELVVTPAQLQAVFVRDPERDRFSNHTAQATGQTAGAFPLFEATTPIAHCLYLAADDLLIRPGPKTLRLEFFTPQASQLEANKANLLWSFWDGQTWQTISDVIAQLRPRVSNVWQVTLSISDHSQPTTVKGVQAHWLQVKYLLPLPAGEESPPTIADIQARVFIIQQNVAPDRCFFNTSPLDISKDFYPFGEQPRFNDTFYIASDEALAHPGSTVHIDVTASTGLPVIPQAHGLELAWEVWTATGWQRQTVTREPTPTSPTPPTPPTLTTSERITLTLPDHIAPGEVNGETHYWLRVRIVAGNYGEAARTEVLPANANADANAVPRVVMHPATYAPPSLAALKLSYNYQASGPLSHCLTDNDFAYSNPLPVVERTFEGDASSGQRVQVLWLDSTAGFAEGDRLRIPADAPDEAAHLYTITTLYRDSPGLILDRSLPSLPEPGTRLFRYFPIFNPTADRRPTLYLGFDRPFSPRPMTLYAQVAAPRPAEASQPQPIAQPPRLEWEYFSPDGWQPLAVKDDTQAFAQRGLIQFVGPPLMAPRSDLGQEGLYWVRSRWQAGTFKLPPRLQRLLTNTTWASQAQTIPEEILGSSNGNPDQQFQATQTPILRGAQLTVQEGQLPSAEEQRALRRQSGPAAITLVEDDTGQLTAVWVRWQPVPNFYGSGPRDRHYTLDHLTGEIRFGNGQQGMIPPLGRNNLRLDYRTGGGDQGDRPRHSITQLKTTVPYIDRVTNLEPAGGGAVQESLAQVQARAPQQLRHRDRAVAAQDFVDLAFAASPDVARARAVTPQFEPLGTDKTQSLWIGEQPLSAGQLARHADLRSHPLQVIIVPHSPDLQPVPSLGLINQVETYLQQRCLPSVAVAVRGPDWVEVRVTATLAVASLEGSDTIHSEVIRQLNRFLHCLTGGRDGRGWDFGRRPHASDFYALLESVPGVAWVQTLAFSPEADEFDDLGAFLIYPGPHTITLAIAQGGT